MRLITVRAECSVLGMWYGETHQISLTERVFKLIQSGHLTWLIENEDLGEVLDG